MAEDKPINYKWTIIVCGCLIVSFCLVWKLGLVPLLHSLPSNSPLSASNGQSFTQSLFNSVFAVSSMLIALSPAAFALLNRDRVGSKKDKESIEHESSGNRYFTLYMIFSISLLIVLGIWCPLCIVEMWYDQSFFFSLFLVFSEAIGYLLLCIPIRWGKTEKAKK